ncbi:hypothetical protein EDF62_3506 [Leucobacter luti]|uniref:Uncharacterized protein n=1 Tax=Leucobacter luti TaxID=340320 RepID=A0A4R6RQH7_9MICO|nr:hypothetical protein [Leucobacter luti]TDP89049.1 hypothetical protein EDF62_3506 [Leucobacter luti]
MRRIGRVLLGLAMIALLFVWLVYRHHNPLSVWATSSTLVGWALQGAAWLSCLGGAYLIATAWSAKPEATDSNADTD